MILPADTPHPPPWGWGQKVKRFTESSHVAYQSVVHHEENILFLHTPSTPGVGSKGRIIFFSDSGRVAYQTKGKEV